MESNEQRMWLQNIIAKLDYIIQDIEEQKKIEEKLNEDELRELDGENVQENMRMRKSEQEEDI